MKIKNTAEIRVGECKQRSNEVVTCVIVMPKVHLKADKEVVCEGEVLTYSVVIHNDCDYTLEKVKFEDRLDDCLSYLDGSFTVNDKKVKLECEKPLIYVFDKIRAHETVLVKFCVKVD